MPAMIEQSLQYLRSDRARKALEADAYWPKWDAPWWHMLLLHEMGHTALIPETTVEAYVEALSRVPMKVFPIPPMEVPAGLHPSRISPCHCQLGNVYQVLAARGVDVDGELPWIRPWLIGYQMADGGMSCDEEAYLVKDECPSSMVGTIAAFEAVLLYTPRPWTSEERAFLEKAAGFLIARELRLGSPTRHNAEERTSAEEWGKLCFPRFYLYDVLRGLSALLQWEERSGRALPPEATRVVARQLTEAFPDGRVRIGRQAFAGKRTIALTPAGDWTRQDAATFPLLEAVSRVGDESPFLTRQWRDAKARLDRDATARGHAPGE